MKLAEALSPVVPMEEMEKILDEYNPAFEKYYHEKMRDKFGLRRMEQDGDRYITEFF